MSVQRWSCFVLCIGVFAVTSTSGKKEPSMQEVRHLIGEPDFRDVTLRWEYDGKIEESPDETQSHPPSFLVNCCELQAWGLSRCRSMVVNKPDQIPNEVFEGQTKRKKVRRGRIYTTKISGLRMATTYSFEVYPLKSGREQKSNDEAEPKHIKRVVVPTKGFSAKATQCLPHVSEVEVSTGPHFGGRIAVEAADGERCAVSGDPTSNRDTYTLRIDHEECGSEVNETTVATYVIVQENLPILTHSTRRFLVLCTYKPETLTVRAGINLPASGSSSNVRYYRPHIGVIEPYEDDSINEINSPRLEARVADDNTQNITQKILTVILVVAGVAGIAFLMWKIIPGTKTDSDTISVASYGSSFSRNTRNNIDNQSDAGSIYSISLSECGHCGDNSRRSNDDNTSEA